ncbi:hypothetical protein PX554_03400 [Sphingomonas sp. H39-1-10]|uniref:hypothetical protein n=1 Tax=Sphingomonas pollutisoli TaxID=3030829 RepID=UPI0023B892AF|nr:hypothetical protein [Sphingomonas pollutisoli]MDF0487165.1 hypothetical protein [Sphingomonas pollutisoli]
MTKPIWKRRATLVQLAENGKIVQPGELNELLDNAVALIGRGVDIEIRLRGHAAIKGEELIALANAPERPQTMMSKLKAMKAAGRF